MYSSIFPSDPIHLRISYRLYVVVLVVAALLTVLYGPIVVLLCLIALVGYAVFRQPQIGLYVLVALSPMIGFEAHGSLLLEWFGRDSYLASFLSSFYAPAVDLWAVFCLVIVGVRYYVDWLQGHDREIVLPGVWLYFLFLCSAVASVMHLPADVMWSSVGYILRFLCFVYLGYIVLGVNVVTKKEILFRALSVYVWVCFTAACLGLISFVTSTYDGSPFHRVVPLAIFGIDLFNYPRHLISGHILLAEIFVTAIPMAVYLAYSATSQRRRRLYTGVAVVTILACLLTFSRAAWLTLLLQAVLCTIFFYRHIPWRRLLPFVPLVSVVGMMLVGYMYIFLQSSIVSSSNSARFALTEIGWYFFTQRPVLGQGAGMYTVLLGNISYFTSQFGDPIDAHGIVTKLTAEQGLFGLITFGLFIWYVLSAIYRRMRSLVFSVEARMAGFLSFFLVVSPLFFQLFNTQYYSARMWVPIMLALSINLLYRHDTSGSTMYISFVSTKDEKRIHTNIS